MHKTTGLNILHKNTVTISERYAMTMHKLMLESDGAVLKQLFMKKNIGYVTKSEKNITVLFKVIVTVVKKSFWFLFKKTLQQLEQ